MELYKYENYDEYVKAQIEGNVRKINNSYVDPISLNVLINQLYEEYNINPKTIICHGTRRGLEQQYFLESYATIGLSPTIIGTEISHTANEYPNTIQWDFHNVKDEWVNSIDLIYSNSFDHSYDPTQCLKSWMSCLSDNGICVLEYSYECDTKCGQTDPFAATLDEYKEFISKDYVIEDILSSEGLDDRGKTHRGIRYFILIKNK